MKAISSLHGLRGGGGGRVRVSTGPVTGDDFDAWVGDQPWHRRGRVPFGKQVQDLVGLGVDDHRSVDVLERVQLCDLERTRRWIADEERRETERRRGIDARPGPPDRLLDHGINGRSPPVCVTGRPSPPSRYTHGGFIAPTHRASPLSGA